MNKKTPPLLANSQKGVMLLEALIAILIFSIGILAIVGLQATSISLASDAKYRSDANLLANRLLGQMWQAHSDVNFATNFNTGGISYAAWATSVAATIPTVGASNPVVTVGPATNISGVPPATPALNSTVSIDIYWVVPGEAATATQHAYHTQTKITN